MKNFADLTEREVLAVAISAEEEDSRIYMTFAEDLAERYPESAKIFEEMAEEERGHRHMLLEMYEQRFGTNLPPIRRDNVRGFLRRRPIWLTKNLSLDAIRREVGTMEFEAERFYVKAAEQTQDVGVRRLLGDLAEAEKGHEKTAAKLTDQLLSPDVRAEEDKTRRRVFVLQYVQPGLAGLMDSSVSTLAPLFAAAARIDLRADDDSRWPRPYHALSGSRFMAQRVLDRDRHRGRRGVLRIMGHRLYSRALYGYAVPAGGVPDRARRRHRARGRHSHRRGVGKHWSDDEPMFQTRLPARPPYASRRGFMDVAGATSERRRRDPGLQRRHRSARPIHDPAAPELYRHRPQGSAVSRWPRFPSQHQRHAGIRLRRDRLVGSRTLFALRHPGPAISVEL